MEANLASHRFLQGQRHFRSDVADKRDRTALARGIYGGADRRIDADGFDGNINTCVVGAAENFRDQIIAGGMQSLGGADFFGKLQARGIHVRDKNCGTSRGAQRLQREEANHSRS